MRRSRPRRQRRDRRTKTGLSRWGITKRWLVDYWFLLVPGVVLLVLPIPIAIALIRPESPPRGEPAAVGFVPPVKPEGDRGFALGMHVTVRGCNKPADVTVTAAGTAEFWLDHRSAFPKQAKFRLAIPGADPGDLRVGPGVDGSTVASPFEDVAGGGDVPALRRDLRVETGRESGAATVASGTVFRWERTFAPVVASFQSDALEERSLGTCYLRIPALTGDFAVFAAQRALGHAERPGAVVGGEDDIVISSQAAGLEALYRPEFETALGLTTVRVDNGDVLTNESLPGPDRTINGNPTWTCRSRPRRTGSAASSQPPDVLRGSSIYTPGALASSAIQRGSTGDCSAVVVISEATAGLKRDLVLLFTGALISLGAAVIVELLLDLLRRLRPGSRDDPATQPAGARPPSA